VKARRRAAGIVVLAFGAVVCAAVVAASLEASSAWTLRVTQVGPASVAVGSIDPAQAVGFFAPQILWSTCALLYNYRDAAAPSGSVLVPEVAAEFPTVLRRGANYAYSIRVRSGFRFDDGRRVTARDFVYAVHRDLAPGMQPSQGPLVLDNLVSATSQGNRITLTMNRPTPELPAMLSSPLFCAVPAGLPTRPTQTAPMAGPYYVASATQSAIVLKRNPYYTGDRPRNPGEIDWSFGTPGDAIPLEVERGDTDFGIVSPTATREIVAQYGVNKSQFFVAPGNQVLCLALNTSRPLFAGNPQLRRAVNFAVDRHALAATWGSYAERRTDQFLPFTLPGFVPASIYPRRGPDLERARELARGHTRNGTAVMFVRGPAQSAQTRAQIVQYDLKQIGIDVAIQPWSPDEQQVLASRGAAFDIADRGCGDVAPYFDPYAMLDLPFDGSLIRRNGNTNLSYIDDSVYDRKLHAAARLTGLARYRAYGRLDVELARDAVPAVP
jgi:ABC-type transport system substrate-binding protein